MSSKPFLVIVGGLSGAGRSVALKSLEDIGFHCMDNLPIEIMSSVSSFIIENDEHQDLFAVGLDFPHMNSVKFIDEFKEKYKDEIDVDFVFLTAEENTLLRRFSTTRRKHPLLDSGGQLIAAIRREATLLKEFEFKADATLDTSQWSPHFLARQLEARYKKKTPGRHLHCTLTSFGFKYGMLRPCDMLIDVRFLKNPFFNEDLKELTGLDVRVREFVQSDSDFNAYYEKLLSYMNFVLPKHYEEGKNYFRMGIGCTGGKHRSVTIAELLSRSLSESMNSDILLSVHHRDIPLSD